MDHSHLTKQSTQAESNSGAEENRITKRKCLWLAGTVRGTSATSSSCTLSTLLLGAFLQFAKPGALPGPLNPAQVEYLYKSCQTELRSSCVLLPETHSPDGIPEPSRTCSSDSSCFNSFQRFRTSCRRGLAPWLSFWQRSCLVISRKGNVEMLTKSRSPPCPSLYLFPTLSYLHLGRFGGVMYQYNWHHLHSTSLVKKRSKLTFLPMIL